MNKLYTIILAAFALVGCTTDIDLCKGEHPHTTDVTFRYDWAKACINPEDKPTHMQVVCDRVINSQISGFVFDTSLESVTKTLGCGTYKFLTVSLDPLSYRYDLLQDYLDGNNRISINDISLSYISYNKESKDPEERKIYEKLDILKDGEKWTPWVDENVYQHSDGTMAGLINPRANAMLRDSVELIEIDTLQNYDITFQPTNLSHNIDIYFDLRKEVEEIKFTIDSVFCVVSGIPHSVRIGDGMLDVTRTDKMMFATRQVDANSVPSISSQTIKDTDTNPKVRCYQNVDVTGIVGNEEMKNTVYTGPGIMQLIIYATIHDDGKEKAVRMQGMINIYDAIKMAGLQVVKDLKYYKAADHSDMYINIDQIITKDMLEGREVYGFPGWKYEEYSIDGQGGNIEL